MEPGPAKPTESEPASQGGRSRRAWFRSGPELSADQCVVATGVDCFEVEVLAGERRDPGRDVDPIHAGRVHTPILGVGRTAGDRRGGRAPTATARH
jgi:hypothetical protein